MVFTLPANLVQKRKKSPRETEEDFKPKEEIPQQKEKQVVTPPQLPPPAQVPLPSAFATESPNILQVVRGSEGAVFLQPLKPSQQQGVGMPQGGLTQEQQAIEAQNIRLEQIKQIFGQAGQITPEMQQRAIAELPAMNLGGAGADILSRGGIGAGAGFLRAGPGGAALGFGVGILTGLMSEFQEEQKSEVSIQYTEFTEARKHLTSIINDVNAGGDPVQAQALFNYVLAKIERTESNLKMGEEKDWKTARKRLTAIQSFNQEGERQMLIGKFNNALLKPNPAAIINIPEETKE